MHMQRSAALAQASFGAVLFGRHLTAVGPCMLAMPQRLGGSFGMGVQGKKQSVPAWVCHHGRYLHLGGPSQLDTQPVPRKRSEDDRGRGSWDKRRPGGRSRRFAIVVRCLGLA